MTPIISFLPNFGQIISSNFHDEFHCYTHVTKVRNTTNKKKMNMNYNICKRVV